MRSVWAVGKIDFRLREFLRFRSATFMNCEHCTNMRIAEAREAGLTEETLQQAMLYDFSNLTEREKAALMFGELVATTPGQITDELYAEVKRFFSDEEIAEMACPASSASPESGCFGSSSTGSNSACSRL